MASDDSDGIKPSPDATVDILLSDIEEDGGGGRPSRVGTIPPPSRVAPPAPRISTPAAISTTSGTLVGAPTPQPTPTNLSAPLRSSPGTKVDRAATAAEDRHAQHALALARACEAELLQNPDPTRAARLHYEAARLYESPVGDLRRAATHYQEALNSVPDHIPALAGDDQEHRAGLAYCIGYFKALLRRANEEVG